MSRLSIGRVALSFAFISGGGGCANSERSPQAPTTLEEEPEKSAPFRPEGRKGAPQDLHLVLEQPQKIKLATAVEVELTSFVTETIAPGPHDDYPAGSGVTFAVRIGDCTVQLSDLSAGYSSQHEGSCGGYRVRFLSYSSSGTSLDLRIEQVDH